MHVLHTSHLANPLDNFCGHFIIRLTIQTSNLDVDWCGEAEVEDLTDDIGRLKEEGQFWKTTRQLTPQGGHVCRSGFGTMMRQRHQNFTVRHPGRRAVSEGHR